MIVGQKGMKDYSRARAAVDIKKNTNEFFFLRKHVGKVYFMYESW